MVQMIIYNTVMCIGLLMYLCFFSRVRNCKHWENPLVLRAKVCQWSRLRVCNIPSSKKRRGSLQLKESIRSKIHLSLLITWHYMTKQKLKERVKKSHLENNKLISNEEAQNCEILVGLCSEITLSNTWHDHIC